MPISPDNFPSHDLISTTATTVHAVGAGPALVLAVLKDARPMTAGELSQRTGLSVPAVKEALDDLTELAVITYSPDGIEMQR